MRENGTMEGSRKDAREMDDERLAQKCARTEQWKEQKKAGIECREMDIRKRRYGDVRNANEMRTV